MTAPNIVNVSSITGSTAVQAIGTSATAIVTNASASNKVYKINTLIVSNVDGTNNAAVNVDLYRSSTAYHIAKTIIVPADASIDILNKAIYLEEGDALRLTADTASRLEGVSSYENIDDA